VPRGAPDGKKKILCKRPDHLKKDIFLKKDFDLKKKRQKRFKKKDFYRFISMSGRYNFSSLIFL
jgi:hypothetical protein